MCILGPGDCCPSVSFLQLALKRAGFETESKSGFFDKNTKKSLVEFQKKAGLLPSGFLDANTNCALLPYYTGYVVHTVRPKDQLYLIAEKYLSSTSAIKIANPGLRADQIKAGDTIIVPLDFQVIPKTVKLSSTIVSYCIRGLAARYPFLNVGEYGKSVMGRPLYYLDTGRGENTVLYSGTHHGNEWITSLVLLRFLEEFSEAYVKGEKIGQCNAGQLFDQTRISLLPLVNPDGMDIATGEISSGSYYHLARSLAANYPSIPFPQGWKANARGVDLNLQYPAGWAQAKENKFAQGFTRPGPRDYVGPRPLAAPESRALYEFTRARSPAMIFAYHSQGEVIYWKYRDLEPPCSHEIALRLGEASGYAVEETPFASGFAGYKDWFIKAYNRPGFTIEVGSGESPLPLEQLEKIYGDNIGILSLGLALTGQDGWCKIT